MKQSLRARLSDPVTERMHQDFTRLAAGLSVGEALAWLRDNPPPGRVIYFYVVDPDGRLLGVVPTRRLLLASVDAPLTEVMVAGVVAVPDSATVLDTCEFFIQHRFLAFPVVDGDGRVRGVVDVDLYTDALAQLRRETPAGRLVAPLARFMAVEASGGIVLLLATAVALALANSPLADAVASFWHTAVDLRVGTFSLASWSEHPDLLHLVVNDGLMTLFFFLAGLEIKRELTSGELADPRKAALPVVAALGGMVMPALLYLLVLWGRPGTKGWAVPMATDIAFVVGILTLLGPRVPHGLKVLLLSLAIADDVGGVLVIAVGFTTHLDAAALGAAVAGLAAVVAMRWLGVRSILAYVLVGVCVWLAALKSGVHPTLAGVVLGLLTPSRGLPDRLRLDLAGDLSDRLAGRRDGHEPTSPLDRLEHGLHPWIAFGIMPLFALANAGVAIEPSALAAPVALAIAVGLAVGKPLGIVLFSAAAVRLGLARLPAGVDWKAMAGAGCLGGIGFTMSLFIAGLAFDGPTNAQAKTGILVGSALSGVVGCVALLAVLPRRSSDRA